jgi:hypothetical protein
VTGNRRDDRFGLARQVDVGPRGVPGRLGLHASPQEDAPGSEE